VAGCRAIFEAQLEVIEPKLLLVFGDFALKTLFAPEQRISRERGKWKTWRGVPVMSTYHPAYLLQNPAEKRATFNDLKMLAAQYDALCGRRT
jgi:DNA polymerase